MSDEDRDIDVESDFEEDDLGPAGQYMTQAEKRKHHNALERKRRDHIKASFNNLRDAIPQLQGEKASRAQILKQATDYIEFMSNKTGSVKSDIDNLKRQNMLLDEQIRALERSNRVGAYSTPSPNLADLDDEEDNVYSDVLKDESDSDESDTDSRDYAPQKRKKLRV